MSIDVACPSCGRLIYASQERAGKSLVCPGCGKRVHAMHSDPVAAPGEEPVLLTCPDCNALIRIVPSVVPRLLGRRIFCTTCGAALLLSLTIKKGTHSAPANGHQAIPDSRRQREGSPDGTVPAFAAAGESPAGASQDYSGEKAGRLPFTLGESFPRECLTSPPADHALAAEHVDPDWAQQGAEHSGLCEELDLGFPEEAEDAGSADSEPLSPREKAVALRDQVISAALQFCIQEGRPRSKSSHPADFPEQAMEEERDGAPAQSVGAMRGHLPGDPAVPWLWPLVAAAAATCLMLALVYALLSAP
ncbi:MAG: hypothetical protein HUU20_04195 [Pirellulales bacterium]|nr:hypothetical protein [Pirellulales bacterium]